MLTATVVGFDGAVARYTSAAHARQRMDELFERLAGGRAYEVEVSPDGVAAGACSARISTAATGHSPPRPASGGRARRTARSPTDSSPSRGPAPPSTAPRA
jgi:hypothetical protein